MREPSIELMQSELPQQPRHFRILPPLYSIFHAKTRHPKKLCRNTLVPKKDAPTSQSYPVTYPNGSSHKPAEQEKFPAEDRCRTLNQQKTTVLPPASWNAVMVLRLV